MPFEADHTAAEGTNHPARRDSRGLQVEDGDEIEFELTPDGRVLMSGLKMIPADKAWFWSESWQEAEREASAQLAHVIWRRIGSYEVFGRP